MTASGTKRSKLNQLISEHVNADYRVTSWKAREIRNGKGELVAQFDDHAVFSYQFSDDQLSQGEFLTELREALALQQVVLSEAEREVRSVTRFSSGLIVGNPYMYSKGEIRLPYDRAGSHIKIKDKFRKLTEEYLIKRMPDLEEARRILADIVPKLTEADLEIRRLREEIRQLRVGRRGMFRRGADADILSELHVGAEFDESCRILGVDPEIFKDMTNEEARKYINGLRKTWASMCHSKGGYLEEMKAKNNAADYLIDHLNGER